MTDMMYTKALSTLNEIAELIRFRLVCRDNHSIHDRVWLSQPTVRKEVVTSVLDTHIRTTVDTAINNGVFQAQQQQVNQLAETAITNAITSGNLGNQLATTNALNDVKQAVIRLHDQWNDFTTHDYPGLVNQITVLNGKVTSLEQSRPTGGVQLP